MRLPAVAATAGVAVLLAGGGAVAYSATVPNPDPCDSQWSPSGTTNERLTKLRNYTDCRMDRIERAIPETTVTVPGPTVTVTGPTPTTSPSSTSPTSTSSTSSSTTSTSPTTTPAGGKPGPANTGVPAGTVLTPTGSLTVTADNTVIDGRDVTGTVEVRAANVTIRNTRIRGSGPYCVYVQSGSARVEDSEISGCDNGIAFDNWTAERVELSGLSDDGVKLGSNVTLRDSWIHGMTPSAGAHADGGQVQGGVRNTLVDHNTIDMGASGSNAALFLAPDLGPSTDGPLTVTRNWLNGGNYILYCVDGNNGQYFIGNITISDNRFGRTFNYGPANVNVPITQSGNVWDDTGAALSL